MCFKLHCSFCSIEKVLTLEIGPLLTVLHNFSQSTLQIDLSEFFQVRRAAVNFIKETLVGLPSLPSDDELAKIQERRKEEIARRVQEERKRAEEMRLKYQNLQVVIIRLLGGIF